MKFWNPHITVATVIERNREFLFVEEIVNGEHVINQPAGHLEQGESFVQAAIRETLEETGWHVEPRYLIAVHRWNCNNDSDTFFRFTLAATPLRHDPDRPLDNGIIRPIWLHKTALAEYSHRLRSPMVLDGVERYLQGQQYPLDVFVDL